ncbi:MAG: hypothetical protein Kow0029_23320 [Candidatus Rifleibacteriota bacterium]
MIFRNRKGVVGFLLTMAVGLAIGAAALVVSKEVQKDSQTSSLRAVSQPSSPEAVEKAFAEYQKAYREYQQAAGLGRADIQKYADAYFKAKRKLEIEIFRNTPGVSEMDMSKFEAEPGKDTAQRERDLSSPDTITAQGSPNPFGGQEIVLTDHEYKADKRPFSSSTLSDKTDPAFSEKIPEAVLAEAKITGMDYYRVKSGDSLSKICEKYYGDSGMWIHILKYQIPAVAATPNLIFPGQLIALPRGFSKGAEVAGFDKPGSGNKDEVYIPSKSYETAPPGDESWQETFQKDYLISDKTLTDDNTMSVNDIQRFLTARQSCLARPYNGSTPAQMIYNAAKKYGINPQVLLTRLQCEQGLISKKSATKKQLDWALGVGCYDSGNWNQKFKGLDKQIEFAAATYRRHYDNALKRMKNGEKISMTIDGRSVTVKNAASYSFYKYCPHFQGNKLFYNVWRGYRKYF